MLTSKKPRKKTSKKLKKKLKTVLLGPVQSLTYALNYGWPSAALGSSWARRLPWQFAVGFGVLARVAGVSGYVALTSWTLGERLVFRVFCFNAVVSG